MNTCKNLNIALVGMLQTLVIHFLVIQWLYCYVQRWLLAGWVDNKVKKKKKHGSGSWQLSGSVWSCYFHFWSQNILLFWQHINLSSYCCREMRTHVFYWCALLKQYSRLFYSFDNIKSTNMLACSSIDRLTCKSVCDPDVWFFLAMHQLF